MVDSGGQVRESFLVEGGNRAQAQDSRFFLTEFETLQATGREYPARWCDGNARSKERGIDRLGFKAWMFRWACKGAQRGSWIITHEEGDRGGVRREGRHYWAASRGRAQLAGRFRTARLVLAIISISWFGVGDLSLRLGGLHDSCCQSSTALFLTQVSSRARMRNSFS